MVNRMISGARIVVVGSLNIAVAFAAAPGAAPPPPVQKVTPVAPLPPTNAAANNLIVRMPVVLTVADAILADGDSVDLKATLRNKSSNAPLPNETIEFKIDGKTAAIIKTDASGQALVKGHKAPGDMTLGTHVMEAHYAGSDSLATATAKGNFALLASNTELTLNPPAFLDTVQHVGDQVTIIGSLRRGTDKQGLAGKKLRFLVDELEVAPLNPYTINPTTGGFQFWFIWPKNKVGDTSIKIVFDGTEKLLPASSKAFKVKSIAGVKPGTMTLTISAPVAMVGDKITLTANLREQPLVAGLPGLPAVGETVSFRNASGQDIGTAVSTGNGDAILQIELTDTLGSKPVAFTARLLNNNAYHAIDAVESQSKLLILPSAVKLTVSAPASGAVGQIVSIKLKLVRSGDSAPVAATVSIPHYFADGNPTALPLGSFGLGGGIPLPAGSTGAGSSSAPAPGNFNLPVFTDANGDATVQYKLPNTAGAVTIQSSKAADPNYNAATGNTVTIAVK
ncbi:MAG: hypothetical protein LH481_17780 [Burkholderiales bacterium]|nr:hypothetical protein [Burkholderiales bacterium]